MAIAALSMNEVFAVSGGVSNDPSCLPGYEVDSYTTDGSGNITSVTCVPTSTTEVMQEGANLVDTVVDIVSGIGGLLGF